MIIVTFKYYGTSIIIAKITGTKGLELCGLADGVFEGPLGEAPATRPWLLGYSVDVTGALNWVRGSSTVM